MKASLALGIALASCIAILSINAYVSERGGGGAKTPLDVTSTTTTTCGVSPTWHTCADTDGIDKSVEGTVENCIGCSCYNYTDECVDSLTLTEYYCVNPLSHYPDITLINCSVGEACGSGHCYTTTTLPGKNNTEACSEDSECLSGNCVRNYTYDQYTVGICCDTGECGYRSQCHENGSWLWMCVCRDGYLVACTTTTQQSTFYPTTTLPPTCTSEGGSFDTGWEEGCCSGLTAVNWSSPDDNETCQMMDYIHKVCTYCGNQVCGTGENICNCPSDCMTNESACTMPGNYEPCDEVSLSEAVDGVSSWLSGLIELSDVIDLIISWIDPGNHPPT